MLDRRLDLRQQIQRIASLDICMRVQGGFVDPKYILRDIVKEILKIDITFIGPCFLLLFLVSALSLVSRGRGSVSNHVHLSLFPQIADLLQTLLNLFL
jgi:hypothetical protein